MIAGWTFGAAAFTDTLDGYIARRFDAESRVGLYLDPIADKLLLSSIYIGLMLGHAIPVWVVALVFGRDLWILLLSGMALRFTQISANLQPSVWGKASTFAQIMTAVANHGGAGLSTTMIFAQLPMYWSGSWPPWRSSAQRTTQVAALGTGIVRGRACTGDNGRVV